MKKNAINWVLVVLAVGITIVSIMLFTMLFRFDSSNEQVGELHTVEISGEYSEEGGPWQTLTRQTFFENLNFRDITVRGHFNREIPNGDKLFLNIDHMWVIMKVNGEEVYSIAPTEGDGNPTRAIGKQWVTIESPGITTDDTIELRFGNLYWNAYMIQFDELLWQMHTGDERLMLFEAVRLDGWTMAVGTVLLFLTLFLLAISLGCGIMRIGGARRFLWLGLATLFSALWFYTLSPAPTMIIHLPVFLNVLYSFSMQALAAFIILFASEHLAGWRRQSLLACVGGLMFLMLIGLINQLFSVQDLYSAINWFSVFDIAIVIWMMFCLIYETHKLKNREAADLMKALLPLMIAAALELINGYLQFSKAAIMLGLGLIVFAIMEEFYTLRRIKQIMTNEKRSLVLENELTQSRIAVMLSQIQPHFLYNALNTIRHLCRTDPNKAVDIVTNFSSYLRGNMDSLTVNNLIPFSHELKHVECYLNIEQARFPGLDIAYILNAQDFFLPPLTLQTIVENAVRHGTTQRDQDDGIITITSWEDDISWHLKVEDNGVGFDTSQIYEDSRSHIGIANTRKRLHTMCGGSLLIDSTPGNGTTATLTIPKV